MRIERRGDSPRWLRWLTGSVVGARVPDLGDRDAGHRSQSAPRYRRLFEAAFTDQGALGHAHGCDAALFHRSGRGSGIPAWVVHIGAERPDIHGRHRCGRWSRLRWQVRAPCQIIAWSWPAAQRAPRGRRAAGIAESVGIHASHWRGADGRSAIASVWTVVVSCESDCE